MLVVCTGGSCTLADRADRRVGVGVGVDDHNSIVFSEPLSVAGGILELSSISRHEDVESGQRDLRNRLSPA